MTRQTKRSKSKSWDVRKKKCVRFQPYYAILEQLTWANASPFALNLFDWNLMYSSIHYCILCTGKWWLGWKWSLLILLRWMETVSRTLMQLAKQEFHVPGMWLHPTCNLRDRSNMMLCRKSWNAGWERSSLVLTIHVKASKCFGFDMIRDYPKKRRKDCVLILSDWNFLLHSQDGTINPDDWEDSQAGVSDINSVFLF